MKKHPGIWFSLWTVITLFLLGFEFAMVEIPRWISGSIVFFYGSICFFWLVVFHIRWIESKMEKENK